MEVTIGRLVLTNCESIIVFTILRWLVGWPTRYLQTKVRTSAS